MEQIQRFCLTLDLRDDAQLMSEYVYWHRPENIWPEIPEGIKAVGILDMEIFKLGTRLFMIIKAVPGFDFDRDMGRLATLPRQQAWETFVSRFQQSDPGETSAGKWKPMDKIFGLSGFIPGNPVE
ncbi:MAG: L-rhamnose mutarotase [Bacteroidota bacterium]